MRRCTRCVLPAICPKIDFDDKGVCNVCREFDLRWLPFQREVASGKRELERILNSCKDEAGKYDCVVPVSGGLDSTYVLYVCKRMYDLRVLAFNFDNGFQTDIAKENMRNAVSRLNVDYISGGPSWEVARKLYALFFRKTGEFCTPCNLGIWSMSYKVAQDSGTRVVVSGSSDRISERLPRGARIYRWSPSYFRQVIRGELSTMDVEEYLHLPQDFHSIVLRKLSRRVFRSRHVTVLPLPDYIDWDTKRILQTLEDELDWTPMGDRFHHIDCIMQPVSDHLKQKKWGFSAAMWYSMLVRTGQITRDEALRLTTAEEERNSVEPLELKLWFELLGLSRDDLLDFERRSQLAYVPVIENFRGAADNTLRRVLGRFGVISYL